MYLPILSSTSDQRTDHHFWRWTPTPETSETETRHPDEIIRPAPSHIVSRNASPEELWKAGEHTSRTCEFARQGGAGHAGERAAET